MRNFSYYISFENLSTANDMAFRVLFENKERMKLVEILKEIRPMTDTVGKKRT
jgi:hypothetical protein